MRVFLNILKEIGIAILLGLLVAGVAALLFYNRIPFSKQIPESINYVNIDKNDYNVRGDVEDMANATETYVSKVSELRYYELIKYILPGRHRPFGSINGVTDLPTEYVGQISAGSSSGDADLGGLEDGGASDLGDEDLDPNDPMLMLDQGQKELGYGSMDSSKLQTESEGQ